MKECILIFLVCCASLTLEAQSIGVDSTEQQGQRDTTTIASQSILDIFYGNPGKAAFYGLIIPGGGQIYNRRWWKLPLVYGLESALVIFIYNSTTKYKGFQNAYINNLVPTNETISYRGISATNILKTNRDKYRQQREYAWVAFIGGHLITIFEAFIDRHLMEFDVSDDLTIGPIPSAVGVIGGVSYKIPISSKRKKKPSDVMPLW